MITENDRNTWSFIGVLRPSARQDRYPTALFTYSLSCRIVAMLFSTSIWLKTTAKLHVNDYYDTITINYAHKE